MVIGNKKISMDPNDKFTEEKVFKLLDKKTNICRFCLRPLNKAVESSEESELNMIELFNIELVAHAVVFLPMFSCSECQSYLQTAYSFLRTVRSSQNLLKKYIEIQTLEGCLEKHEECIDDDCYREYTESVLQTTEYNSCGESENRNSFNGFAVTNDDESSKQAGREKQYVKKRPNLLANNMRRVHRSINQRIYGCMQCNKRYRSNYELKIHLRTHTGEKPYSCSTCDKMFCDTRNLRRHEKIHIGKKDHKCHICYREFLHSFSLRTHERTHIGDNHYVCEMCGKSFVTSGQLKIHSRIHTNIKPYECKHCKRSFKSKSALNVHMITHTGEKPHHCATCFLKCRSPYDLKVHMRSHNNEKPYKCQHANCKKSYKYSSQMSVHMRTHTGEKPHQCPMCFKRFGETNTLKRHLNSHDKSNNAT